MSEEKLAVEPLAAEELEQVPEHLDDASGKDAPAAVRPIGAPAAPPSTRSGDRARLSA
jgi:hypothetical protein